jgi:hypothetical protein
MMYEMQTFPHHQVFMLLATSADGINDWVPYNTTSMLPHLPNRIYFNQVLSGANSNECGSVVDEIAKANMRTVGGTCEDTDASAGLSSVPSPPSAVEAGQLKLRLFCETSMYTSTDGVAWRDTAAPWQPIATDYPVSAFYNNVTKLWQMQARPREGDRRVATHTFNSTWGQRDPPMLALDADALDSSLAEIYGQYVFNYDGYVDMYHVPQGITAAEVLHNSPHKYLTGKSDVYLAYSLNGVHWARTVREPLIANGPPGAADAGLIYPTAAATDVSDGSLVVTASASPFEHGIFAAPNGTGSGAILTYRFRKHGLVFLESEGGVGLVGTTVLYWASGEARVNVNAAGGTVLCRVTGEAGNQPLAGYDWSDADAFSADDTGWVPTWSSGKTLDGLVRNESHAGNHALIRFEFQLVNARLYSISGDFHPISSPEVHGPFPPVPRPGFEPGW